MCQLKQRVEVCQRWITVWRNNTIQNILNQDSLPPCCCRAPTANLKQWPHVWGNLRRKSCSFRQSGVSCRSHGNAVLLQLVNWNPCHCLAVVLDALRMPADAVLNT